jgi:hypothetical protein
MTTKVGDEMTSPHHISIQKLMFILELRQNKSTGT